MFHSSRYSILLSVIAMSAIIFSGCANLNTLNRTTPITQAKSRGEVQAQAIHLDAHQRLVMINSAQQFCAEPSPDSLVAFAASLGGGISGLSKERAASVAAALQSSSANIGLRTQSITLMRDALYRICEANLNGSLNPALVATLLGRSQDLTAVVLAIEQLTGAVVGPSVVLAAKSSADASSILLSNDKLIAKAEAEEAKAKQTHDTADKTHSAAVSASATHDAKVVVAQTAYDDAADDADTKTELLGELNALKAEKATLDGKVTDAAAALQEAKEAYDRAKETTEAVKDAKDSALADVHASASGSGSVQFIDARPKPDDEALKSVAASVSTMVQAVLNKKYHDDTCMALLTTAASPNLDPSVKSQLSDTVVKCLEMIGAKAEEQTIRAKLNSANLVD